MDFTESGTRENYSPVMMGKADNGQLRVCRRLHAAHKLLKVSSIVHVEENDDEWWIPKIIPLDITNLKEWISVEVVLTMTQDA